MKPQIAIASKIIHVPADNIYEIIADYRTGHPLILPKPYFLSLDVEEGGIGEGTIVNFQMRLLGRTQFFRSLITEPDPGRVIVETDIRSGTPTIFRISPLAGETHTRVTLSTELVNRGAVEGLIGKWMLQKIYRAELELLAGQAEKHAALTQAATSVH
ncbi:MAG TPA: SRPBCC family protein [Anaerolineales bacterium]|nr:SRPBCC family protein [Anaerolineales bacterium]